MPGKKVEIDRDVLVKTNFFAVVGVIAILGIVGLALITLFSKTVSVLFREELPEVKVGQEYTVHRSEDLEIKIQVERVEGSKIYGNLTISSPNGEVNDIYRDQDFDYIHSCGFQVNYTLESGVSRNRTFDKCLEFNGWTVVPIDIDWYW